jgi:hypothetical protein
LPRLIRSAVLSNYVEVARSVGLDPYQMITEFRLPAVSLSDPEVKVSVAAVGRLLEESATRSGKVDFGLRLADKRTVANVGALALLVREQPTIRKALDVMAGYIFLHGESLLLNMKEQDGEVKLSLAFDVDRPVPIRQGVELGIGFLHRSLQQLFRERWKPQMVCFTHAAPQRKMLIENSLAPMFFSMRISMESSVARLISMRLCRRQMQKWRGMRSNISTRLRRAARAP